MDPIEIITVADVAVVLRDINDDGLRRCEADLWEFVSPLYDWLDELLSDGLPTDWRQQLDAYLAEQVPKGYEIQPQHRPPLDEWVEYWGLHWRPLLARVKAAVTEEHPSSSAVTNGTGTTRPPTSATPAPAPLFTTPPQTNWPRLTPKERDEVQKGTGLPSWYPFQPRNRTDAVWEQLFEDVARSARDRLLELFQELAALGRTAREMGMAQEADLETLSAQGAKVQKAYDAYLQARIRFEREWTRYLETEWLIGVDVIALVKKIDDALPVRIEGLKSPLDAQVKDARRASLRAHEAARERVEGIYTAVVWTDRVIAAIQLVTFVGTVKAGAVQVFNYNLAKGVTRAAAVKAAATYMVTQLAVAGGTGAIASQVVPEVLSYAGLDEAEVQIGIAAFAAIGILVGLRTERAVRGMVTRTKKTPRPQPTRRRRSMAGTAFNRSQAHRYPYNEIYIRKPDGPGYYKLDSYDDVKREIVSRKHTQLAELEFKSAIAYLNEFTRKYSPGRTIANVPSNGSLAGKRLVGVMIFEVPVQHKRIPKQVLEAATNRTIKIRDVNGREYN